MTANVRYGPEIAVVAFGLAALVAMPAEPSAAPMMSGVVSQTQSSVSQPRDDLLLIHCCHSHPYPPYDSYCCHEGRYYAPGSAVVGAAVAYGTYRGVKSAAKKHYKHAKKHYKSRR